MVKTVQSNGTAQTPQLTNKKPISPGKKGSGIRSRKSPSKQGLSPSQSTREIVSLYSRHGTTRTIPLPELASAREAKWLKEHGEHIYEEKDLLKEFMEEMADGWNYANRSKLDPKEIAYIHLILESLCRWVGTRKDW